VRLAIEVGDPSIWPGLEVQTDAAGRFDFGPQRRGHYLLQAFDDRDASRVVAVNAGSGDVAVEVFSYPCRELAGKVVRAPVKGYSPDDVLPPVAGARVELLGRTVATSDAAGQFRFCGPRDEVVVLGRAPGLAVGFDWAVSAADDPSPRRLIVGLDDGVAVDGVVVDAGGQPVSGVGVQPVYDSRVDHGGPSAAPVIATTDERGRFHVEGLHEGAYCFEILDGVRSAVIRDGVAAGFRLPAQGPLRLVMPAPEPTKPAPAARRERHGVWIRGRVVHDGQPVPDAVVTGGGTERRVAWSHDVARTAADGSFALFVATWRDRVARAYLIAVEHGGLDLRGRTALELQPGGADLDGLVIRVGDGRDVGGVVVDQQGVPIEGVVVTTFSPGRDDRPTDATGTFRVEVDPRRTYRLRAFDAAGDELRPPAGMAAPRVDAALYGWRGPSLRFVVERAPARLRGVVVDERGTPVRARVGIAVSGPDAAVDTDTDAGGAFALEPTDAPAAVVAESADGRVAIQHDVELGTPVRLVLRRPARLVVTCGPGIDRRTMINVVQGSFGRWTRCGQMLDGLPPGRFQIVARATGGDATAMVELRAGAQTRRRLAVSPRRTIRARAVDVASGAPVKDADCGARIAEASHGILTGHLVQSAADGTFSITRAASWVRLTCEHPRYHRGGSAPFDAAATDGVVEVPMRLAPLTPGDDER
jgi:hypothetical protein